MCRPFFWVVFLCALGCSFVHAETVLYFESTDPSIGLANVKTTLSVLNSTSLEVTVKNMSPVFLPGGNNLPAITGFGFDINETDLDLLEWTLSAYDYDCEAETMELEYLAGNQPGIEYLNAGWVLEEKGKVGNIRLDFYAQTTNGVNNAFYNPEAAVLDASAFAGNSHFFTDAVLTLTFDRAFSIPTAQAYINEDDPTAMIRMQNTALCGEESLKLFPVDPPTPIPEPSSFCFIVGLLACLLVRRRSVIMDTVIMDTVGGCYFWLLLDGVFGQLLLLN